MAVAPADMYVVHAVPIQRDPRDGPQHVFQRQQEDPIAIPTVIVSELLVVITNYNNKKQKIETEGTTNLLELELAALNAVIVDISERMWDTETFGKLVLTCDDDFFLEVLMSNVKGSVISFQSWVKKVDNIKKLLLIKNISHLIRDFNANSDLILEKEKALSDICNRPGNYCKGKKYENLCLFECRETLPNVFFNLARVSNSNKKLSAICKPTGEPCESDLQRNDYIALYTEDIYRKDSTEPENFHGCVEKFLGDEIVANPIVQNSRFIVPERN